MMPLNAYQEVVDVDALPPEAVIDVIHGLLQYLKLEIVREATPDYTVYEIRPQSE